MREHVLAVAEEHPERRQRVRRNHRRGEGRHERGDGGPRLVAAETVEPRGLGGDEIVAGDHDLRPGQPDRLAHGVGVVLEVGEALASVGEVVDARFDRGHPPLDLVLRRLGLAARRVDGEREQVDACGLGGVPRLEAAAVHDVGAQHRSFGAERVEPRLRRLGCRRRNRADEREREDDGSAEHRLDRSGEDCLDV